LALTIGFVSVAYADTFNQNRIADDAVFDNVNTMDAAQIDAFLNSFAGSCLSTNNGFSAPDPIGYDPAGSPNPGFHFGANVSAGNVIYHAAQAYQLNPQVLLATLQKEQSLVTGSRGCHPTTPDTAHPYDCNLYNSNPPQSYHCTDACPFAYGGGCIPIAVGYGCPGSCNADQEGFSQQIIRAAWFFKFGEERSEGNVNWAIIKPGWDNSDDPQSCYKGPMTEGTWSRGPSQCGATKFYDGYTPIDNTSVHMDTGATAALYWYTPHFSGNQSFFNIFTSWFGPTLVSAYSWQYVDQGAYTDSSMTTPVNLDSIVVGSRYYLVLHAKNVGTATWSQGYVNLGTSQPNDRISSLHDSTWPSNNRAATLLEPSVAPGATGTFGFWVTVSKVGAYKEYFNLVAENFSWMTDYGLYWEFGVQPQHYTWLWTGQSAYTDATKTRPADLSKVIAGSRIYLTLQGKNTGNVAWKQNYLNLGTWQPTDRSSAFHDSTWPTANRAATIEQASVDPNQTGSFGFWATVPLTPGTYKEYFDPVADGVSWLNDYGVYWQFTVQPQQYTWLWTGQGAYTDATKTTSVDLNNVTAGSRIFLTLQGKNTGNVTWRQNYINLGTWRPTDRTSAFHDSTWPKTNRAGTIEQATVDPGQTGSFGFWVTAPTTPGNYKEYFDPVADGYSWMNDYGLYWQFVVH
jgi:hypothetical protein